MAFRQQPFQHMFADKAGCAREENFHGEILNVCFLRSTLSEAEGEEIPIASNVIRRDPAPPLQAAYLLKTCSMNGSTSLLLTSIGI